MGKKQIKVTYSSTNEKSIEEVIKSLIRVHEGRGDVNIKKKKKVT